MSDKPGNGETTDFESMTFEEADAAMEQGLGLIQEEVVDPGPDVPEVAEETEPVEEPTEPEVTEAEPEVAEQAEAAPESEPEETPAEPVEPNYPADVEALLEERMAIWNKQKEADLAIQRAHSSRLAGELGHLKKQLQERSNPTELAPESDYAPEARPDLERRLLEMEQNQLVQARTAAIENEVARFQSLVGEAKYTSEELGPIAEKYASHWQAALDTSDPGSASDLARAVLSRIAADAEEVRFNARRKEAEAKRAAQYAESVKAMKEATISGSGSTPPPKEQPKTYADMSAEELDAEMARLYGSR